MNCQGYGAQYSELRRGFKHKKAIHPGLNMKTPSGYGATLDWYLMHLFVSHCKTRVPHYCINKMDGYLIEQRPVYSQSNNI